MIREQQGPESAEHPLAEWERVVSDLEASRQQSLAELSSVEVPGMLHELDEETFRSLGRDQKLKLIIEWFAPEGRLQGYYGDKRRDQISWYEEGDTLIANAADALSELVTLPDGRPDPALLQRHRIPELVIACTVATEGKNRFTPFESQYMVLSRMVGSMRQFVTDERLARVVDTEAVSTVVRSLKRQHAPEYVSSASVFLAQWGIVNAHATDSLLRSVIGDESLQLRDVENLSMLEQIYQSDRWSTGEREQSAVHRLEVTTETKRTDYDRFYEKSGLRYDITPFLRAFEKYEPGDPEFTSTQALHRFGVHLVNNRVTPPFEQRVAFINEALRLAGPSLSGRLIRFSRYGNEGNLAGSAISYARQAWPRFTQRFTQATDKGFIVDLDSLERAVGEFTRRRDLAQRQEDLIRRSAVSIQIRDAVESARAEAPSMTAPAEVLLKDSAPAHDSLPKEQKLPRLSWYSSDDRHHTSRQTFKELEALLGGASYLDTAGSMGRCELLSTFTESRDTDSAATLRLAELLRAMREQEGVEPPTKEALALLLGGKLEFGGKEQPPGFVFVRALLGSERIGGDPEVQMDPPLVQRLFRRAADDLWQFLSTRRDLFRDPSFAAFFDADHVLAHVGELRSRTVNDARADAIYKACRPSDNQMGKELTQFAQLLAQADILSRTVRLTDSEFTFTDAINPSLVERMHDFSSATRHQLLYGDRTYQIPILGMYRIGLADSLVVTGQAGAGKSNFVETLRHAVEAAASGWMPDAREVGVATAQNLIGRAYRVGRAESTYEGALFENNVEQLRKQIETLFSECPRETPVLWVMDEPNIGTERWRATLLAQSTVAALKRIFPNLVPVIVSHEGEAHYRVGLALSGVTGLTPRPVALNPETRQPFEGIAHGDGVLTARWIGFDTGITDRTAKLERARQEGNPLDLSAFGAETGEPNPEHLRESSFGFNEKTLADIGVLRMVENNSGLVAELKNAFQRARGFDLPERVRNSLVEMFGRTAIDLSFRDQNTLAMFHAASEKMSKVQESLLLPAVRAVAQSADTLRAFSDTVTDQSAVDLLRLLDKPDDFREAITYLGKYFKFIGLSESDIATHSEAFMASAPEFADRFRKAYVRRFAGKLIERDIDLTKLQMLQEFGFQDLRLDDDARRELVATGPDRLEEAVTSLVVHGKSDALEELLIVARRPTSPLEGGNIRAELKTGMYHIAALGDRAPADDDIERIARAIAGSKDQGLQFSITLEDIIDDQHRLSYRAVKDAVSQLAFATVISGLRKQVGGLHVQVCGVKRDLAPGAFPIAVSGAVDPTRKLAVEREKGAYHPQDFLSPERTDVRYLTGPNGSGKTAIAQNLSFQFWAARVLGVGFAKDLRVSPDFDEYDMVVSVNPEEIYHEDSTFMGQLRHTQQNVVEPIERSLAQGRRVLAFVDEPFNGIGSEDKSIFIPSLIHRFTSGRLQGRAAFLITNHEASVYDVHRRINEASLEHGLPETAWRALAMDSSTFQVKDYDEVAASEPYAVFRKVLERSEDNRVKALGRTIVELAGSLESVDQMIQQRLEAAKQWI